MRVMQISGALAGAQKTIEEAIHRHLLRLGHESCILYACGRATVDGEICYENKFENLLCRAGRKYIYKTSRFAILQTIRLIRYIKRFRPDIVHLHVIHHGYTDYSMLLRYLAKAKLPVVYTMHDLWAITGGCYHYTVNQCDGIENGCSCCKGNKYTLDEGGSPSRILQNKKQLLGQIEKLYIVSVSDWVGAEIKKSFLANRPQCVILNGVDMPAEIVQAGKLKATQSAPVCLLGVAASWTERKGIEKIFRMAQLLGEGYEFRLVGGATPELQSRAPQNVIFEGYCTDKKQLMAYYSGADLHISASLEETFGMTFVEAALAGTKSIGFASTAIEQTLKCVHGIAVREFTAETMCVAIRENVEAGNTGLTAEQIKQIRADLSSENMAEKYCKVYYALA